MNPIISVAAQLLEVFGVSQMFVNFVGVLFGLIVIFAGIRMIAGHK